MHTSSFDHAVPGSTRRSVGLPGGLFTNFAILGATENVADFNHTADIGLHFGVTRAFGRR